jgi:hypothetical protein
LKLRRNPRPPPRSGFPAPERLETFTVSTDEGSRRYERQHPFPIEPAAEPKKGQASWMGNSAGLDPALLIEPELFAQEEILARERASRSETENQEGSKSAIKVRQSRHNSVTELFPWLSLYSLQIGHNLSRFKSCR